MSTKIENNSKVEVAVPIEYLLENFQNLRIIQPSLIFLHGIPEFLSNPNVSRSLFEETNPINIDLRCS